jgi:hypothetical protein
MGEPAHDHVDDDDGEGYDLSTAVRKPVEKVPLTGKHYGNVEIGSDNYRDWERHCHQPHLIMAESSMISFFSNT